MTDPIRVIIHQPALPKYRVPVFRELATRQGLRISVWYGDEPGLPSVPPDGFDGRPVHCKRWAKPTLYWVPDHLRSVDRRVADVLVLPWNTRFLSLLPTLTLARSRGIGTVLWGHGYSKKESAFRAWIRRRPVRLANAAMFYSRSVRDRFAEGEPDQSKLFVAPNALDQTPIQTARDSWLNRPELLTQFQRDKGIDGEDNIIFVSRLEWANRVDLLVRATAILAKGDRPSVKTIIVGAGAELENLKKLAADLGISQNMRFAGAVYGEQDIAPYWMSAKVFCYPRNIGLSLIHAFGYALPVVTTDSRESQNPEIDAFEPGENGMTYRDLDVEDLARVLNGMLADRDRTGAMSRYAHQTVLGKFSMPSMVDGMEAAIRHAAKR